MAKQKRETFVVWRWFSQFQMVTAICSQLLTPTITNEDILSNFAMTKIANCVTQRNQRIGPSIQW